MAYTGNSPVEISETQDYSNQVSQSKQIILDMVKRIAEMSCEELTPGRWEKKPVKLGGSVMISEVYKPDTRIGYCNAMDFLIAWVYPDANKDFKTMVTGLWTSEAKISIPMRKEKELFDKFVDEKVNRRLELFKEMCIMFSKERFFDDTSGYVDRPSD